VDQRAQIFLDNVLLMIESGAMRKKQNKSQNLWQTVGDGMVGVRVVKNYCETDSRPSKRHDHGFMPRHA
jgi:hypothetical protein